MISDTIEEKEVVDTYLDHPKHKHFYHPDCSQCFVEGKGNKKTLEEWQAKRIILANPDYSFGQDQREDMLRSYQTNPFENERM